MKILSHTIASRKSAFYTFQMTRTNQTPYFCFTTLFVVCSLGSAQVDQPSIVKLDLARGFNTSYFNQKHGRTASVAVSDDWSTIGLTSWLSVVSTDSRAVVWKRDTGLVNLGQLGTSGSFLGSLSRDGSQVYGMSMPTGLRVDLFQWTSATGMTSIGQVGNGPGGTSPDGMTQYFTSIDSNNNNVLVKATGNSTVSSAPVATTNGSSLITSGNGQVAYGTYIPGGNYTVNRWDGSGAVTNLGHLGGGNTSVSGVNNDGSVAIGSSYTSQGLPHAYRWTQETGIQRLVPANLTQYTRSSGGNIYANGDVVIGGLEDSGFKDRLFKWSTTGGFVDLGHLGSGQAFSKFINPSGTKIYGESSLANFAGARAFVWTDSTGMVDLGITGLTTVSTSAVSTDFDRAIISGQTSSGQKRIYTVDPSNVVTQLTSPDTTNMTFIEADKSATRMFVYTSTRAYAWSLANGFSAIGDVNGQAIGSIDTFSPDHRLAAGSVSIAGTRHAWIWDGVNGASDLKSLLISRGVDMTGWDSLNSVELIEDFNGAPRVVGLGTYNGVSGFKYYATVPEPGTIAVLGLGSVALVRRRKRGLRN